MTDKADKKPHSKNARSESLHSQNHIRRVRWEIRWDAIQRRLGHKP